jgi:Arc/MetJ-type ribon-helix-helix transcriptional regulator
MSEKPEEVQVEVVQESKKEASTGKSVGQAINNIMDTLEAALSGRGNTVMVRVNDEALKKLDMLVEAGICKSRSESVAFLLQRGIEGSGAIFDRIESVTAKIAKMRHDLMQSVGDIGRK